MKALLTATAPARRVAASLALAAGALFLLFQALPATATPVPPSEGRPLRRDLDILRQVGELEATRPQPAELQAPEQAPEQAHASPGAGSPTWLADYAAVWMAYWDTDWEIGYGSNSWLTSDSEPDYYPSLDRGAHRIAWSSHLEGNFDISVMNRDASGRVRLTDAIADDLHPDWSPDGSLIVFQSDRDGQPEIYLMNADGSGQHRLTYNPDDDADPTFSPDGTRIAFTSRRNGQYRIWTMDLQGGDLRQVNDVPYSQHPAWSPDGTMIGFDADGNDDGWQDLWVMNADGSNPRVLIYGGGNYAIDYLASDWTAAGEFLLYSRVVYRLSGGAYYVSDYYWSGYRLSSTDYLGESWGIFPTWAALDTVPPVVHTVPFANVAPARLNLSWSGSDTGGAFIMGYDLEVQDGVGPWQRLLTASPATSSVYYGKASHTYRFRVRAIDWAGNMSDWVHFGPGVTIESLPPSICVVMWGPPHLVRNGDYLNFDGWDPGGSRIGSRSVWYRDITAGTDWVAWVTDTEWNGAFFEGGELGQQYAFRAQAVDVAGNVSPFQPDGCVIATVVSDFWANAVTDHIGVPVTGASVTVSPGGLSFGPSDVWGNFVVASVDPGPHVLRTSKLGYGTSVRPAIGFPQMLPPADNAVNNGEFLWGDTGWVFGSGASLEQLDGIWYALLRPQIGVDSWLSQRLTVPTGIHPGLTFDYNRMPTNSRFDVTVDDGIASSVLYSNSGIDGGAGRPWLSLAAWAGRAVTVTFSHHAVQPSEYPPVQTFISRIMAGRTFTDLETETWFEVIPEPGQTSAFRLNYSNHGATATATRVTLTLPSQVQFVSAEPPPAVPGQEAVWELGALGWGAWGTITVTVKIDEGVVLPSGGVEVRAVINSDEPELETLNNEASYRIKPIFRTYLPFFTRWW